MSGLVEQRSVYMSRLEGLVKARNAEIDAKVQAYRAQLEKETLSDEMVTLVKFIEQIDAMIAYDKGEVIDVSDAATEMQVENAIEELEADVEKVASQEQVEDEAVTNEHEIVKDEQQTGSADIASTIAGDIADTKAQLQNVAQPRPNLSSIFMSRH